MFGSSASGNHHTWVSTVMRLPMSWLTPADSNLNPQSRQLWLMSRPYCVGETAKRWRAAIGRNDDSRLAKLCEAQRAGDYSAHLIRGHAVQVFRMRVNHVLLLASMSKRGGSQSASCRLCKNRVEDVDYVLFDCPALEAAEVPVRGARTEPRFSGLSFPCSWKRRN